MGSAISDTLSQGAAEPYGLNWKALHPTNCILRCQQLFAKLISKNAMPGDVQAGKSLQGAQAQCSSQLSS